jgi:alpha-beta hydrolase superfamily lysophospholipase
MDWSFLETPEVLEVVFPLAYSQSLPESNFEASPVSAKIEPVEVGSGVKIYCGFWVDSQDSPSILYFHGNGETVASYEWIAPIFNRSGINLFMTEYRGYGISDGRPTLSNMLTDAHTVLSSLWEIIEKEGYKQSIFVMGRSLGSLPAIEVAFHHQDRINGLIVESGSADNLSRLWEHLKVSEKRLLLDERSTYLNKAKIRQISKPTLIIHGENDRVLPVTEGYELYRNSGSEVKKLVIVPRANHNDIMSVDQCLYFNSISDFVNAYS